MAHASQHHPRRSIRLQGYDYSQAGAYFVTICTHERECLLGNVVEAEMQLNHLGEIVRACWEDLPKHYPHLELDESAIMPNHVHAIIVLHDFEGAERAGLRPAPTKYQPLSEIVRAFKGFSARRVNEWRGTPGGKLWQRNYYEHIIRDDESLWKTREYISNNPLQWEMDRDNPASLYM